MRITFLLGEFFSLIICWHFRNRKGSWILINCKILKNRLSVYAVYRAWIQWTMAAVFWAEVVGSFTSSHASVSRLRGWSVTCSVIALNLTNPHRHTYDFLATPRKPAKAAAAVWRRSFLFPVPVPMTVGCRAFVRSTSTVVLLPSGISERVGWAVLPCEFKRKSIYG